MEVNCNRCGGPYRARKDCPVCLGTGAIAPCIVTAEAVIEYVRGSLRDDSQCTSIHDAIEKVAVTLDEIEVEVKPWLGESD